MTPRRSSLGLRRAKYKFKNRWRPEISKRIGFWIWYLRQEHKEEEPCLDKNGKTRERITRRQMSDDFGWKATAFLYQMETGQRAPGYDVLGRIAEYFDVDPSLLFRKPSPEQWQMMKRNKRRAGRPVIDKTAVSGTSSPEDAAPRGSLGF